MRLGMVASKSSISSYSEVTKKRIKGLDASEEFAKLAIKMKKPPGELRIILAQRLSKAPSMTEKEEYVDWLLSGVIRDIEGVQASCCCFIENRTIARIGTESHRRKSDLPNRCSVRRRFENQFALEFQKGRGGNGFDVHDGDSIQNI